jgi:hypothetical protein
MDDVRPDSSETQHLLQQAGAGEKAAFERLFAEHRPQLRQFVERRLVAAPSCGNGQGGRRG